MTLARGQITIVDLNDGENGLDAAQPNLFGYDNVLSCTGGTMLHTNNGAVAYAKGSADLYFNIKQTNNTNFPIGVYSISYKVKVLSVSSGDSIVLRQTMHKGFFLEGSVWVNGGNPLEVGKEYASAFKFNLTEPFFPFVYTNMGGTEKSVVLLISDLKIERAENINGISTPFDGLANDSIPQGQNLLLNTADFGEGWRTQDSHDKAFDGTLQGNKVLYYQGGKYSAGNYYNFALYFPDLVAGKTYTWSWWQRGNTTLYVAVQNIYPTSGQTNLVVRDCNAPIVVTNQTAIVSHAMTGDWEFHSITFKPTSVNGAEKPYIRFCADGQYNVSGKNFYIAMSKLEEGEKPTAWQMNEADRRGADGQKGEDGANGTNGKDAEFIRLDDNGCAAVLDINTTEDSEQKGHPQMTIKTSVNLVRIKGDVETLINNEIESLICYFCGVGENSNWSDDIDVSNNSTTVIQYDNDAWSDINIEDSSFIEFAAETKNGKVYYLRLPVTFNHGVTFDINQKTNELNAWASDGEGSLAHLGISPKEILQKLGDTGIDITKGNIKLKSETTTFEDENGKQIAVFNSKGINAEMVNLVGSKYACLFGLVNETHNGVTTAEPNLIWCEKEYKDDGSWVVGNVVCRVHQNGLWFPVSVSAVLDKYTSGISTIVTQNGYRYNYSFQVYFNLTNIGYATGNFGSDNLKAEAIVRSSGQTNKTSLTTSLIPKPINPDEEETFIFRGIRDITESSLLASPVQIDVKIYYNGQLIVNDSYTSEINV